MPRQKISEFRAKTMVCAALQLSYDGWSIDATKPLVTQLDVAHDQLFVVKVDEGVKGRFKQGLVLLNVKAEDVLRAIEELHSKGYRWLLVEPMVTHEAHDERYLQLSYNRQGLHLTYNSSGGVDIELHSDQSRTYDLSRPINWDQLAQNTGFSESQLQALTGLFKQQHLTFLEINPYVVIDGLQLLDLAIEVDDAAAYFATNWALADIRRPSARLLTPQEKTVARLNDTSPASFNLTVLNSDGAVFVLLSGGGASLAIADEIYAAGFGARLANYGEYSGDPTTDETYVYAKALLELLMASSAPAKRLIIAGAVANFTDIAQTFKGIVRAIEEVSSQLQAQNVKIFVRRGGPHQEIGLADMQTTLATHKLLGAVHGPETTLPEIIHEALEELS